MPTKVAPLIEAKGPTKDKQEIRHSIVGCIEVDRGDGPDGKPKREIVLTCLQEGPGNVVDKRYYMRSAIEGLEKKLYARKKIFVDHIGEEDGDQGDPMRNWAATVMKTWLVTESDGLMKRKVRLKIHEDWLWRRLVRLLSPSRKPRVGVGAG